MQIIETQDRELYNQVVLAANGSVLQSWAWGEFQKKLGRKVWRLILNANAGKPLLAATVVKMPLAAGKSYFYCPRGPVAPASPHLAKMWQLFLDKLEDFVVVEKPVFLRVDPAIAAAPRAFDVRQFGFKKISWEIQPATTLLVDVQKTDEQLLAGMKPKTRYNINLASRKGVTVEQVGDGSKTKLFWELMAETTARDHFSPHPYFYYATLLDVLGRQGAAELLLATYQRRPLAGAIVSYFGATATYLHGVSSDKLRATMAPYLLQWTAIKAARARQCRWYDFGGSAPEGSGPGHPWAGITRFKKGFGGQETSYLGAFDLPYDRWWYRAYRLARWANRIRSK